MEKRSGVTRRFVLVLFASSKARRTKGAELATSLNRLTYRFPCNMLMAVSSGHGTPTVREH